GRVPRSDRPRGGRPKTRSPANPVQLFWLSASGRFLLGPPLKQSKCQVVADARFRVTPHADERRPMTNRTSGFVPYAGQAGVDIHETLHLAGWIEARSFPVAMSRKLLD